MQCREKAKGCDRALRSTYGWRNTTGSAVYSTAKASVSLGQSHINTWDRVARSGQLPARLQHAILALSPVTYILTLLSPSISFSLVSLPVCSLSLSLQFRLSSFINRAHTSLLPSSCLYLSPTRALEIIIPACESAKDLRIYRSVNVCTGCADIRTQQADPWSLIGNVYIGSTRAHASPWIPRWKMNDR